MHKGKIPIHTISPERNDAGPGADVLRRLIIDTAYDQTDVLDVPVFDPAAKLRMVPYVEAAAEGLVFDRSLPAPLDRAVKAVHWVMSASQRFEPLNQTPIHRSYPSPRSLYPVGVDFVLSGYGAEHRFRYDPEHNGIVGDFGTLVQGGYRLRLDVMAILDRISPLYGDLAPTLCALEAGHVCYLLCDALVEQGTALDGFFAGTPAASCGAAAYSEEIAYPVASIHLVGDPIEFAVSPQNLTRLRISKPRLSPADRARTRRAFSRLACPPVRPLAVPGFGQAGAAASIKENARQGRLRSSGHFPFGMFGERVADEEIDSLCNGLIKTYRSQVDSSDPQRLQLDFLRPKPDGSVTVINAGSDTRPDSRESGHVKLAAAFGSEFNIDLDTIPFVLVFSAPFAEIINEKSSWSYFHMLSLAGFLAQQFCISATNFGFFARPFKGVISKEIESGFNIPGQVFYTMIFGRRTPPGAHFSLGPTEESR